MSLPPLSPPSRGLRILKTVLYILAWLILALGLIIGISLMISANSMVGTLLLPLHLMGNPAIVAMVTPLVRGFFINLGVITLVISLVISLLLYGLGRLISRIALLEARLSRLEALPENRISPAPHS